MKKSVLIGNTENNSTNELTLYLYHYKIHVYIDQL